MPILDYTPSWANNGAGAYNPPTNVADFAHFGAVVVARYGSGGTFWKSHPKLTPAPIKAVEVWDEPWCKNTWVTPDPAGYAQMVRQLHDAVKAVNPTVLIAASTDASNENGVSGTPIPWVTALTNAFPDMASYVDVASVHLYGQNQLDQTPSLAPALATVTTALSSDNVTVPLWVTETGANATALSTAYFGAPAKTIVPDAWTLQGNFMTTTLDTLNALAPTDSITRVYGFSFSRSTSDTAWSAKDSLDSGWLLEGPTGTVRGAGTALFAWAAAHATPQATATILQATPATPTTSLSTPSTTQPPQRTDD